MEILDPRCAYIRYNDIYLDQMLTMFCMYVIDVICFPFLFVYGGVKITHTGSSSATLASEQIERVWHSRPPKITPGLTNPAPRDLLLRHYAERFHVFVELGDSSPSAVLVVRKQSGNNLFQKAWTVTWGDICSPIITKPSPRVYVGVFAQLFQAVPLAFWDCFF